MIDKQLKAMMDKKGSVSYTHLDVYKRQCRTRVDCNESFGLSSILDFT